MVQESKTKIVRTRTIHKYICDKCNKVIGSSMEYEDGYIPVPDGVNGISVSFCFDKQWYKYKSKIYCNDCIESAKEDFIKQIKEIGFVEED